MNLRHLECRPSDGKWILSDDTPLNPVTEAHGGHRLVHLSWNEVGSELAVADSSGRVSIYNIAIGLNSLAGQRQASYDADEDGAQIVGMMWLNIQRSVSAFQTRIGPMGLICYRFMRSTKQPRCKVDGRTPRFDAVPSVLSTPLERRRWSVSQNPA